MRFINNFMEKITKENFFETNIEALTLNSRFGALIFEKAFKQLSRAQKDFKELVDLNYPELLSTKDVSRVNNLLDIFITHLEWLRNFDISIVDNAKAEHDNFENRVESFFNDLYENVSMKFLPFLREERRRENPEDKKFDEEVLRIVKIRENLEKELSGVQEEIQKIRTTEKQVGSAKGERASVRMAVYFNEEMTRYNNRAKKWLIAVISGYIIIVALLIYITANYSRLVQDLIKLNSYNFESVILPFSSKLLLLAALWYGLSFVIKNYNVSSQLTAVNRHRAAVAKTLEDFLAVEQQQENPRLSEILKSATDAMFKHSLVGFISKKEKENSSPILQVVNDMMGARNN